MPLSELRKDAYRHFEGHIRDLLQSVLVGEGDRVKVASGEENAREKVTVSGFQDQQAEESRHKPLRRSCDRGHALRLPIQSEVVGVGARRRCGPRILFLNAQVARASEVAGKVTSESHKQC